MTPDELLEYLKNTVELHLPPLEAILQQTEAIGDPALPSARQSAILQWLGAAVTEWEQHFPLEEPLASQLRALKPLTAALAVTDRHFLQPGAHPIHQLLDTVQSRAIGWQPQLGRAGQALEQQVTKAVNNALAWFDNRNTDLEPICAELSAVAERDQERAQRMAQRVVETEQGRVKTAEAKRQSAQMINAALEQYRAPEEIGEFLKGPWYNSAQLVLLKCGADSEQWQKMTATTNTLLDSLQTQEEEEESRRQHLFEVVTQLPKDMRRWLLSLHHDTDAVNDAMGMVEYAHLRVLRKQPLELELIEPIASSQTGENKGEADKTAALEGVEPGEWFRVDTGNNEPVRVQLVLKSETEQQLLFTNQAGIKVLQQSYREFADLLEQQKVTSLHAGASFSICLATAAGVNSAEALEILASTAAETDRLEEEAKQRAKEVRQQQEETRQQREREKAQRLQQEHEDAQRLAQELEEAKRIEQEHAQAQRLQQEQEQEQEEAQRVEREREQAQRLEWEQQEIQRLQEERAEAERLEQEQAEAERREQQDRERLTLEQEAAERQRQEEEQALAELQRRKEEQARRDELEHEEGATLLQQAEAAEQAATGSLDDTPEQGQSPQATAVELVPPAPAGAQDNAFAETAANEPDSGAGAEVTLNLPMGAWLGFHDGDTPLMAKLAVHDREQDQYIFVNREGIKMRQLSKPELLKLMDAGLVDILQTNSNFRDEVTQARNQFE